MPLNFFLNKYLASIHEIDCGSHFIYFGTLPGGSMKNSIVYRYSFRIEVEKICDNKYLVNTTLFLLSGEKIQYDKTDISNPFKADNISIIYTNTVTVDEKDELISILFPITDSLQNNGNYYVMYKKPFAIYAKPSSIGYVPHYIALPKEVVKEEYPILVNQSLPPLFYMYYKVGNRFVLYNAILENMNFIKFLFSDRNFPNITTDIWRAGFIDLVYTNTVPGDQDWLYAIQYEFGVRLYPLPLVLISTGIILIIITLRQGR